MTQPDRRRLPNRRLQLTTVLVWRGGKWLMSVGFDHSGQAREVFLQGDVIDGGAKFGSELEVTLTDACILVSLLLQHGAPPAMIHHSLSREPHSPDEAEASPIGAICAQLVELQAAAGQGVREAYAAAHAGGRLP